MHRSLRCSAIVFTVLVCFLATAVTVQASEIHADSSDHVLVTISMGAGSSAAAREYQLMVAGGGEAARLFTGARVPIPTTRFQTQGAGVSPLTSFTYQDIGFTARVRTWLLDGKIKIDAEIEESRIAEESSHVSQPVVQTAQQTIQALLTDGKAVRVLRAGDAAGPRSYIELTAEIVR